MGPLRLLSLALLAFTSLARGVAPPAVDGVEPPAAATGGTSGPSGTDSRLERFVLELAGDPGADGSDSDAAPRPQALIEWRRSETAEGTLLEREVWFMPEDVRVRQVEVTPSATAPDALPRLVWRERGRDGAADRLGYTRGLLVEPARTEGRWSVVDWFAGRVVRGECEASWTEPPFPLGLLERLREDGLGASERVARLDPLLRRIEQVTVEAIAPETFGLPVGAGFAPARAWALRRPDGMLAIAVLFEGERLIAFRWQEAGPVARRVDEVEYRRLEARWKGGTSAGRSEGGT